METSEDHVVKIALAEASLELVPTEITNHPSVIKNALRRGKKPYETILDVSLHYYAMKGLPNKEKRGRPDILHITMLNLLSSPLNLEGKLKLVIHTYGDYCIKVDPLTKLPRNYLRFVGLMEQLLISGRVPQRNKPLMEAIPSSFNNALKILNASKSIALTEKGDIKSPEEVCEESLREGLPIVIGAFPHGGFSKDIYSTFEKEYSIYPKPLDAWIVASIITHACEKVLHILL